MSDFFAMGGYAVYIWPAYGVSAVVLIGIVLQSQAAWRCASRDVAGLETGAPIYGSRVKPPEDIAKPDAGS